MGSHSRAEKTKTHKRLVSLASKRFREKGLTGIGIAELMKEAGLTVGGFYKHFDSRDDLVAEALGYAVGPWEPPALGRPPVTYDSLIDSYLTEAHRDHPGTGCPVGALAGDVARSEKRTRAIATRKIVESLDRLENSIRETSGEDKGTARSLAIMTWCGLVGAITLARAVSDQRLSREILKTVAQLLKTSPRHHGR